MKKFLVAFFMLLLFVTVACADVYNVGFLAKLNMTEKEFQDFIIERRNNIASSQIFSSNKNDISREMNVKFYDSLMSMQMALDAGEIEAMALPEDVAEYVMNTARKYSIGSIVITEPISLALGFRKGDDPALRNRFNEALSQMKLDGTLSVLKAKYIYDAGISDPEPVSFSKFDNIKDKVKVAITGDMPPIDFIAADGTPAGFNTAVLAELGKRMKINIEVINVDAGARAASLASGRSDVVFWFTMPVKHSDNEKGTDVPDDIVLSEPYYSWDETFHIKLSK